MATRGNKNSITMKTTYSSSLLVDIFLYLPKTHDIGVSTPKYTNTCVEYFASYRSLDKNILTRLLFDFGMASYQRCLNRADSDC